MIVLNRMRRIVVMVLNEDEEDCGDCVEQDEEDCGDCVEGER